MNTYVKIVEALKPPESELDDDTRNILDEELSRSGSKTDPASSDGTEPRPDDGEDDGEDDEVVSDGDPPDTLDLSKPPKKKRRRH